MMGIKLVALLVALSLPAVLATTCDMDADTCEFWLDITFQLTMMDYKTAVYPKGGRLYPYNENRTSVEYSIKDTSKIISVDGWENSRLVIVANGTLPGPSIEVYEGQKIIIHVKNDLISESTSIHWHGLHQPNTPFMDGVSYISQCPIGPGQTFTYRFTATPKGTFWYHSHIGVQRSMGLYGAFIIREKKALEMEEHLAVLNDWNHDWNSDEGYNRMVYGMYMNRTKLGGTSSLDGSYFSLFRFHSGLINGKGRYYNDIGQHNEAPLHVFNVSAGLKHKFRWMSTGSLYPFRISIDEHNITVIASDGYDLQPVVAESVVINPGERFDFYITTDKPIGNYWIRAQTLEVDTYHVAEAILRYNGAADEEPTSSRKKCSKSDQCVVINCPFSFYPAGEFTTCMTFDDLKSLPNDDPAPTMSPQNSGEHFLNFAFPGTTWTPGSVNGRALELPPVSAQTQPHELGMRKCGEECGEQKICKCLYTLDLDHGKVYQLVFTNMAKGGGWSHPIHMHGHSFHVVKMGYAPYNSTTGIRIGENMDIDCRGGVPREQSFCNDATWSNASWVGGNIPGLELKNPPRKDTIIVPTGGYVVVRIKADNPGLWFMHCHIEIHHMDGMAMALNESFSRQPKTPVGFPKCGDYRGSGEESVTADSTEMENMVTNQQYWVTTGVLIGVIVLLLVVLALKVFCQAKKKNDNYKVKTSGSEVNPGFTMAS
ncbi:hypothetical protein SNE40_014763 [Patella caerulea]|uniref:Laccase n=1 Tax=Patella caerulea TaxID=87958 RepID=A0AAN8JLQ7_PATCE